MTQEWQQDLNQFFAQMEESDAQKQQQQQTQAEENAAFFQSVVAPAFDEIRTALEEHGRKVTVHVGPDSASIVVYFDDVEELNYSVTTTGLLVYPETRSIDGSDGKRLRNEGVFRPGDQDYSVSDIPKAELIAHCLNEYKLGVAHSQQKVL